MPSGFKTVAVVGKGDAANLPDVLAELTRVVKQSGLAVLMDSATAQVARTPPDGVMDLEQMARRADLVVVLGGDGTLIASARHFAQHDVPLVGVNLGRLGFLTDIPADALAPAIESILAGEFSAEQRTLLQGGVRRGSRTMVSALAMNDVVVSRGSVGSMIEFAVTVDGEFIYTLRADGVIVATATGSTAYALSAGGPIVHPGLNALALVPISPHTLSNRPVVIRSSSRIEITLVRGTDARANFDVQAHFQLEPNDVVTVQAAAKPATLLHPKGYRYFSMLRQKLRWNERAS